MNKSLPLLIIAIVLIGAIGATVWFVSQNKTTSTPSNSNSPKPSPTNQLITSLPPGADPPWTRGPSTAPVTIEEFSDFQCPACGNEFPILKDMKTAYGEQLRIIFRQYPLTQIHPKAIEASRATEAAGRFGKFWEMHDLIYSKQKEWTASTAEPREIFADYAKTLGLDVDKFKDEMLNPVVSNRIAMDLKRGDAVPVRGTPTLLLNGRLLSQEEMTSDGLRKAIDAAIKEKQGQSTSVKPAENTTNNSNGSNNTSK